MRCCRREAAHRWCSTVTERRSGNCRSLAAALAFPFAWATWLPAQQPCPPQPTAPSIPCVASGTAIALRLTSPVDGARSTAAAPFTAVVIAPIVLEGKLAIAPGAPVWGHQSRHGHDRHARPVLELTFDSLGVDAGTIPVALRLTGVDNVRESVDSTGLIAGAPAHTALRTPTSWVSLLLGAFHPVAAAALLAESRGHAFEHGRPIRYPAGTDLAAVFSRELALPAWSTVVPLQPAADVDVLTTRASTWPIRATRVRAGRDGDLVNVAFIGDSATISAAFLKAGWDVPGKMDVHTNLVTFVKAMERRGYLHQPVSAQELDGRAPSLVFQRVGNTFAKRHHIRLWRWSASDDVSNDETIYLAAATHDVGITFDSDRKSFTHRVDAAIDQERDKVANDLWFAGCVAGLTRVPRKFSDSLTLNDGRDRVDSDRRMAVIRLRDTCGQ